MFLSSKGAREYCNCPQPVLGQVASVVGGGSPPPDGGVEGPVLGNSKKQKLEQVTPSVSGNKEVSTFCAELDGKNKVFLETACTLTESASTWYKAQSISIAVGTHRSASHVTV